MTILLITSCLSVAKISSFAQTSDSIDFNSVSSKRPDLNDSQWSTETSNEYYFETNKVIDEDILFDSMIESLRNTGYAVKPFNRENNCVLGVRGIRGNEWRSIVGIYFKNDNIGNKTQVYIICRITQDITGGWKENRAREIGEKLKYKIKQTNR